MFNYFIIRFSRLLKLRSLKKCNPTCILLSSSLDRVKLGQNVAVLSNVRLIDVVVGEYSYIADNSQLRNVLVGRFCSIGPEVKIGFGAHPSRNFVSTYPAFYTPDNPGCPSRFRINKIFDDSISMTIINHDVWIGANTLILGGVTIGTGAIVAAGAVVVKDVPPYAIVGGNPAKIIRYRFSDDEIDHLLKTEWWLWPIEKIRSRIEDFSDVNTFINSPI